MVVGKVKMNAFIVQLITKVKVTVKVFNVHIQSTPIMGTGTDLRRYLCPGQDNILRINSITFITNDRTTSRELRGKSVR